MKLRNLKLLGALFLLSTVSFAQQQEEAMKYANTITKEDLYDDLSILASDALEGRETGTRGQKMAAAYIRAHFESIGLTAPVKTAGGMSYYQEFSLETSAPGETYIITPDGQKLENGTDMLYWGSNDTGGEQSVELVFLGKGTEDDFKSADVKGKAAVLYIEGNFGVFNEKKTLADANGAALLIIVNTKTDEDYKDLIAGWKPYFMGTSMGFAKKEKNKSGGVAFISNNSASKLFGTTPEKIQKALDASEAGKSKPYSKIKSKGMQLKTSRKIKEVKTENVMGFLEGTDKKDEIVVISSHYDHIGRNGDEINNGADDDGSGTSALLEISEAFSEAKKAGNGPRRSILFLTVTGEEKGLLGSEYYVNNPVFPLENTVVDLNIDMVGRIDPEHEGKEDYVYLVGSNRLSTELHDISEMVNKTYAQFNLDYTYNDESHPDRIYYRSDHWNFAKNNIPIIFYFNGTHADYHKPTDTVEKIEFDLLAKRAKLVYHTAWVLANRENRVVVDKIQDTKLKSDN